MPTKAQALQTALDRADDLEARLRDSEETLEAIGRGDFDAVVTRDGSANHRIYTLETADSPYRLLIEQIQEGALTLTAGGLVLYCNRRLAEMLDLPQERVIGQLLEPLVRPVDRPALANLLRCARLGVARCELSFIRPNLEPIAVYVSLSSLPNHSDQQVLCGVVGDLTQYHQHMRELSDANERLVAESAQRERIETTLRQSQKMEAVGQLTGGLAHDFNNLLAVIMGSLELLQGDLKESQLDKISDYADVAMQAASRAAAVTHRLLAFSRLQTLAPRLVSPNKLIIDMAEILRRTMGPAMTLRTSLPADVGAIYCDSNQLENALLNLAINARDAMPDGGTMTISTANVQVDEDAASARELVPGEYVTLSVADTGTGMSATVMARAFDPFFTTKPIGRGTGLGLSMIYGFAKQSGGQARIESVPGLGTTVSLMLPRAAGQVRPDVPPALHQPRPARRSGGQTILLVDDEPDLRMVLARVLRRLGYRTLEAADGRAALGIITADESIDLLVTDVGLPAGMNGRQLAGAARLLRPGLKVLFITGFEQSAGSGPEALDGETMTKPFVMDDLADKIRGMLREPIAPA